MKQDCSTYGGGVGCGPKNLEQVRGLHAASCTLLLHAAQLTVKMLTENVQRETPNAGCYMLNAKRWMLFAQR
jgi:hypothetical protein